MCVFASFTSCLVSFLSSAHSMMLPSVSVSLGSPVVLERLHQGESSASGDHSGLMLKAAMLLPSHSDFVTGLCKRYH